MARLSQPSVSYRAPYARWRSLLAGRDIVRAIWVVELLVLDVAVAGNTLWMERVVAALLLAVLPGRLLLRALRVPASSVYQYVAYLPCASVAVLVASTLLVDLVGPPLGLHEPLRRLPLLVGLNLALLGLAALGHRAPDSCNLSMSDLIGRVRWLWPLLLPVVSVAAAARLDNGAGNLLAVVVVIACAVMIPICTVKADSMHRRQTKLLLYSSGLSLMLLTSMRSSYVIGFDINSEYFDFHQTVLNGVWHFGHLNPYEAMLSLTVLPASLHALIGGQDVWMFKLGYPALFALFPVAVFELGTRFLSRRAAFVAAALVVSQAYFFQQQPEIARQELALLIFAGIVGVLFDTSLGRNVQIILISVLGVTLVVCHYSTTYITIGLCLMASVVAKVLSFRRPTKIPVARWLVASGVMTLAAVVWYLPATHSTSNITGAVQSIRQSGFQLLPGRQKGESIISAYFNGLRQAPSSPKQYQASIARYYSENRSYLVPLPQATDPAYNLRAAPSLAVPDHSPALGSFLNDAELLVQQTINAAAVIGALVFALRRRGDPLTRMVGAIGVASFAVLVASRLSGALATDYNSSRLFLQCLFILSLLEAALIEVVVKRFKAGAALGTVLFGGFSLMLVIAFVGNSGLAVPVVGGDPALILSNNGEDHAAFYPETQEEVTAAWLAKTVPPNRVIYADYYAQLRLDQFTNLRSGVFVDITPRTIDQHGWVYASTANVVGHRTWGLTSSGVLDIAFPSAFLREYFNVVYSTGATEIFHR